MNTTKIIVAASVLLVVAGTSSAHTVGPTTLGGVSPGTADFTGVGVFGAAFCQNLPTVGGSLPFFCGQNGLGVFFDVSGIDNGDRHSHANGNCKVVQGTQRLNGNEFFFSCGTDRNDDNFVTDNEVCTIEDDTDNHGGTVSNHDECTGQTGGTPNEQHADDWVDGTQANQATGVNFCFQDDVTAFTPADDTDDTGQAGDDVSALNQAVGSWDDFVVFVGIAVPGSNVFAGHVGDITVTLSATGGAACSGVPNNWVSAHSTGGNTRTRILTQCSDALDNDAVEGIDAADPSCRAGGSLGPSGVYQWWDNNEVDTNVANTSECTDNQDNDGDGLSDAADPQCTAPFASDDNEAA